MIFDSPPPREHGLYLKYRFRKSKESRMYDLEQVEELYNISRSKGMHLDVQWSLLATSFTSRDFLAKSAIAV